MVFMQYWGCRSPSHTQAFMKALTRLISRSSSPSLLPYKQGPNPASALMSDTEAPGLTPCQRVSVTCNITIICTGGQEELESFRAKSLKNRLWDTLVLQLGRDIPIRLPYISF